MFLLNLLVYLMGHSLADTALQPDSMARGKSRRNPIDMSRVPVGQKPIKLWYHWLTHHALIHGLLALSVTYFLTQNKEMALTIGLVETIAHWVIDFCKCESWTNPNQDQILHITMKIIYCLLI